VPLDRVHADHQPGRDFHVRAALGQQREDLSLAGGQPVRPPAAAGSARRGNQRGVAGQAFGFSQQTGQDPRIRALADEIGGFADPRAGLGRWPAAGMDASQAQQRGGRLDAGLPAPGAFQRSARERLGLGQLATVGEQAGRGQVGGDGSPRAGQPVAGGNVRRLAQVAAGRLAVAAPGRDRRHAAQRPQLRQLAGRPVSMPDHLLEEPAGVLILATPEQGCTQHGQGRGSPLPAACLQFQFCGLTAGCLGGGEITDVVTIGRAQVGRARHHGRGPVVDGAHRRGRLGRRQPSLHVLQATPVVRGQAPDQAHPGVFGDYVRRQAVEP
jgi:hypothetical protein